MPRAVEPDPSGLDPLPGIALGLPDGAPLVPLPELDRSGVMLPLDCASCSGPLIVSALT
jgi:hypothetical protein